MPLVLPRQIATAVSTATVHRRATCWEIARQDLSGVVYRITDHPRPLELFDGFTYSPKDGAQASAHRKEAELRSQERELEGIISLDNSVIGEGVLRAKQLINSRITEYLVDWGFPWRQPLERAVYWVRDQEHDSGDYKIEITGIVDWLEQPKGEVSGPT